MKENKKTYLYLVIFAVVLLIVMVVALFLTKKNDGKDANKTNNNGNEQQQGQTIPVNENKNHKNLINNLNSIEFGGKKLEIKITENKEEGFKEIAVDGEVISNIDINSQLAGVYIYNDWLVFVENRYGYYNLPLYNMNNKTVTELSNIDSLVIFEYVIEDNGILVKTKNHTDDHFLLIDDEEVNYCNQEALNAKNITDSNVVQANYQIILTEGNFDVNIIDESTKTLKDIKTNC